MPDNSTEMQWTENINKQNDHKNRCKLRRARLHASRPNLNLSKWVCFPLLLSYSWICMFCNRLCVYPTRTFATTHRILLLKRIWLSGIDGERFFILPLDSLRSLTSEREYARREKEREMKNKRSNKMNDNECSSSFVCAFAWLCYFYSWKFVSWNDRVAMISNVFGERLFGIEFLLDNFMTKFWIWSYKSGEIDRFWWKERRFYCFSMIFT